MEQAGSGMRYAAQNMFQKRHVSVKECGKRDVRKRVISSLYRLSETYKRDPVKRRKKGLKLQKRPRKEVTNETPFCERVW